MFSISALIAFMTVDIFVTIGCQDYKQIFFTNFVTK